MIYKITHKTGYNYSEPASLSQNELFLHPRTTPAQKIVYSNLSISPEPQYRHHRIDYFGNSVAVFMVQHPHNTLAVSASSTVETTNPITPDPSATMPWEEVASRLAKQRYTADFDARQFIFESPLISVIPHSLDYAKESFSPGAPILSCALEMMSRIFREFTYDKTASTVDTTVEQVFANRKGVCQDYAHLTISCLRSLGLAARYVSGYLETLPPPGKPRLVGADASHAWVALYLPEFGWVDFDPTNNQLANERYITLAWGRDYGDVAPVKGVVMGGGRHRLSVSVDVAAQES